MALERLLIRARLIAVGIPARETRRRFDDDTIKAVRDSQWWEWDEKRLREAYKQFSDVKEFLKFANS